MLPEGKFANLVEAVVYIALKSKPNAVSGTEICQAQNLPPRYLEAELQNLVRIGVLKSVRGPAGGYVLARERRNISLADIFLAELQQNKNQQPKTEFAKSVLTPIAQTIEDEVTETLKEISIADMVQFSVAAGIVKEEDASAEFVI